MFYCWFCLKDTGMTTRGLIFKNAIPYHPCRLQQQRAINNPSVVIILVFNKQTSTLFLCLH